MKAWGLNQGFSQLVIGIPRHDQVMPPVFPAMALQIPGLFDGPAYMGWHPGRLLTHKVGKKTHFDGNPAVQQGHDVGYLIFHMALPLNLMMVINPLTSKHKVMFPITKVLIESKPMGTYCFFMFLGLICSSPVSLPTGICWPFAGTVQTNMTWKDFFLGVAFIVVDIVIDLIFKKIIQGNRGKKVTEAVYKFTVGRIVKGRIANISNNFFKTALGKLKDHMGKTWVFSPLFSGSVFQGAQTLGWTHTPRTEVPGIAVGRAGAHVALFPWGGVRGNVFN
jgi:hypothetical protein